MQHFCKMLPKINLEAVEIVRNSTQRAAAWDSTSLFEGRSSTMMISNCCQPQTALRSQNANARGGDAHTVHLTTPRSEGRPPQFLVGQRVGPVGPIKCTSDKTQNGSSWKNVLKQKKNPP